MNKNEIIAAYIAATEAEKAAKQRSRRANRMWYAVQTSREDDWGTGSYDLEEAMRMAKAQKADYPETLIAVIDNSTSNPVCVEEITQEKMAALDKRPS